MTLEVLKALAVILEFCMNQDSCKNCPMGCHVSGNLIPFGKMPRLPSGVEFSHKLGL